MTRKMFTMAAFGALAAATPAAAQWNGSVVNTQNLRAQIDEGVARGDLSPDAAANLRSQLRGLVNLQRQYAQDGLSASEREDLRQRAQGLRNEIADAEGQAAPSGYGYGNSYRGNPNAYGNRYGGDDNGAYANDRSYDNGTYNNRRYNGGYGNGTYDNRTYGNGAYPNRYGNNQYDRDEGAYPDNSDRNDSRYGRDNGDDRDDSYDEGGYGLRVGDRATGDLYGVPNAYRYRFRDGGGVYYRYGSGNVYQIDSRTGVVLRIYPIGR